MVGKISLNRSSSSGLNEENEFQDESSSTALLSMWSYVHKTNGTGKSLSLAYEESNTYVQKLQVVGYGVGENVRASLWKPVCHDRSDKFIIHRNIP